jgi:hypothetical protein
MPWHHRRHIRFFYRIPCSGCRARSLVPVQSSGFNSIYTTDACDATRPAVCTTTHLRPLWRTKSRTFAFVSTFHTPKHSIWANSDEKCLQKGLTHIFFDVSISSFGEHKNFIADVHFNYIRRMPLVPLFLDNPHFDEFIKSVNHKSRLNYLTSSPKWGLSKKGD